MVGYAAIVFLRNVNIFEITGYVANITINFMSGLVDDLVVVLLYFLLIPVAEARYGLIKCALLMGALAVANSLASLLINTLLTGPMEAIVHMTWTSSSWISDVLGIISSFAFGVLVVAVYRMTLRRIPGTWVLYVALGGLIDQLFLMITNPLRSSGPSENLALYNVVRLLRSLVIALLSLGVLAGYKKWSSFQAFAADLKQGVLKLRGMQDDGEA